MKKLRCLLAVCFVLTVCFLILSACGDKADIPSVSDGTLTFTLHGQQKAVITVENGMCTGGKMFTYSGEYIGTFVAEHLKKSKSTRLVCVYENINAASRIGAVKTVLIVDKMGNLIESRRCNSNDEAIDLRKYDYKYNRAGHTVKCQAYVNGEKWYFAEYKLDSDGKSYMYKKTYGRTVALYNAYGDIVSKVTYNSDGTVESEVTYEYEYSDNGKALVCAIYEDGAWQYTVKYTYDEVDRLVKVTVDYSEHYLEKKYEIEYTYDEEGNEYEVEKIFYGNSLSVTKTENGMECYMATYYTNGNIEWETLYREDRNRVKIMENGKSVFKYFPYLSISYEENGEKAEERLYEPVYDGERYVGRQLVEEIIYKDEYSKTLYEYGDNCQTVLVYDESERLIYTYRYEDIYDSKGRLAYRDEYENGVLKIRSVYSTEGELMFTNLYVDGELRIQNIYKRSEQDRNTDGKIKETKTSNFTELPSLDR